MVGHHQKGLDRPSGKPRQLFGKLPNVDVEDLLEMLLVPVDAVAISGLVVVEDWDSNCQWVVEAVVAFNNVVPVLDTIPALDVEMFPILEAHPQVVDPHLHRILVDTTDQHNNGTATTFQHRNSI